MYSTKAEVNDFLRQEQISWNSLLASLQSETKLKNNGKIKIENY